MWWLSWTRESTITSKINICRFLFPILRFVVHWLLGKVRNSVMPHPAKNMLFLFINLMNCVLKLTRAPDYGVSYLVSPLRIKRTKTPSLPYPRPIIAKISLQKIQIVANLAKITFSTLVWQLQQLLVRHKCCISIDTTQPEKKVCATLYVLLSVSNICWKQSMPPKTNVKHQVSREENIPVHWQNLI